MNLILASVLFLVLQVLDVVTTHIGLSLGMLESNSLANALLEQYGEWVMYLFKTLLEVWLVVFVWRMNERYKGVPLKALWTACGVYLLVVGNNLSVIGVL